MERTIAKYRNEVGLPDTSNQGCRTMEVHMYLLYFYMYIYIYTCTQTITRKLNLQQKYVYIYGHDLCDQNE